MNFVNDWKASMSMGYCQSVQMAFELARCARWNVQIKSPKWATLSNFTVKRLTTKWCGLRKMIEIVNPSVTVSAILKFKDVPCDFHHRGYKPLVNWQNKKGFNFMSGLVIMPVLPKTARSYSYISSRLQLFGMQKLKKGTWTPNCCMLSLS